jgi:hypothetical protein
MVVVCWIKLNIQSGAADERAGAAGEEHGPECGEAGDHGCSPQQEGPQQPLPTHAGSISVGLEQGQSVEKLEAMAALLNRKVHSNHYLHMHVV